MCGGKSDGGVGFVGRREEVKKNRKDTPITCQAQAETGYLKIGRDVKKEGWWWVRVGGGGGVAAREDERFEE